MTNPATTEAELLEREGALAYLSGLPLCACPYQGETAEWWADGWWRAYRREHPPLRTRPLTIRNHIQ